MKKILFILIIISVLIVGCSVKQTELIEKEEVKEPLEVAEPEAQEEKIDLSVVIEECDSLCNNDEEAYCNQERTISIKGIEVSGTCRAFSKTNHVDGFNKCQGYCKFYDKAGTVCEVGGKTDENCDGVI